MALDIDRLQNANLVDQDGDKIGSISQIYLDDQTNQPTFATVKTGLFGGKGTFVPLDRATESGDGNLQVPYTKDFVKDAPNVDDDGHLSEQEQDDIYRYYQLDSAGGRDGQDGYAAGGTTTGRDDVDRADTDRRDGDYAASGLAGTGRDRGADAGQDANHLDDRRAEGRDDASVTLREEQLKVGKERVETGRVRLRKHVVTEQKTVTVPVEREEYEVVREPIENGQVGGQLGEDEAEIRLSEERPVVDKQVVDKERVGLQANTVQENREVQAEVGHEEVEIDQDGVSSRDAKGFRDNN